MALRSGLGCGYAARLRRAARLACMLSQTSASSGLTSRSTATMPRRTSAAMDVSALAAASFRQRSSGFATGSVKSGLVALVIRSSLFGVSSWSGDRSLELCNSSWRPRGACKAASSVLCAGLRFLSYCYCSRRAAPRTRAPHGWRPQCSTCRSTKRGGPNITAPGVRGLCPRLLAPTGFSSEASRKLGQNSACRRVGTPWPCKNPSEIACIRSSARLDEAPTAWRRSARSTS